jgi:mannose-6-phosphate isomerase-like protein (cupin superfamily)
MNVHELSELLQRQADSGNRYLEFIKVPSLSVGVYHLPAGGADPQQPHTEDEVYYVVSGQAAIRVGEEDRPVSAGSVVFVAAEVEHRFHSISDDLILLVLFAPAEYSNRKA